LQNITALLANTIITGIFRAIERQHYNRAANIINQLQKHARAGSAKKFFEKDEK
jgi:hypothetical protein